MDSIKLEVEELKKEIASYEEQLKTVEETLEQYQKQLDELQEKANEAKVQLIITIYCKTCVKWPLKKRQNKNLNDKSPWSILQYF